MRTGASSFRLNVCRTAKSRRISRRTARSAITWRWRGTIGGWFVWHDDQTEPIQLAAGGSGILPLMSMIQSRAAAGSSAPFRLLYSVRHPASIWYRDEFQNLTADDHGVDVRYVYTRSAPPNWPRPHPPASIPRFSRLPVGRRRSRLRPMSAAPTSFVEHVAGLLTSLGHSPERIELSGSGPREISRKHDRRRRTLDDEGRVR